MCNRAYLVDNSDSLEIKAVLSQGQVIEKPGAKIAWVENTLATLYGRQQEKLTIQQQYPNNSVVFLDRGQHEGEIKSLGDHFLVQQTTDQQTVIHDNSVLKLAPPIVGDRIRIAYQNGVHDLTNYSQQQRVERIAPILLDYLQLHQKQFVENNNSIVKFDRETKTIFYRSKSDKDERLKAQYQDGRWLDLKSCTLDALLMPSINDRFISGVVHSH